MTLQRHNLLSECVNFDHPSLVLEISGFNCLGQPQQLLANLLLQLMS